MKRFGTTLLFSFSCLVWSSVGNTTFQKVRNTKDQTFPSSGLIVAGPEIHRTKLLASLEEIAKIPIGSEILRRISEAKHSVLLSDHPRALPASGLTGYVAKPGNISNGIGDDAYIVMDFDMPEQGAHLVDGCEGLVEFTFVQTLFHELVHAAHIVKGSFNVRDPEFQAKLTENKFRKEEARAKGKKITQRCGSGNRQIWNGRNRQAYSFEFSYLFVLP